MGRTVRFLFDDARYGPTTRHAEQAFCTNGHVYICVQYIAQAPAPSILRNLAFSPMTGVFQSKPQLAPRTPYMHLSRHTYSRIIVTPRKMRYMSAPLRLIASACQSMAHTQ